MESNIGSDNVAKAIQLLIVDDEEAFVAFMTKRLILHDFDVHAFTNPVEALEQTAARCFAIGILDLKMPEMDGEELLAKLKERDPAMEIIILTGHGSVYSAFLSGQRGAYEYLLKPCSFDGLLQSINQAFAKRLKGLSPDHASEVDRQMEQAAKSSPFDMLRRLRQLHHGWQEHLAAAAIAESGDPDQAKQRSDRHTKKPDE